MKKINVIGFILFVELLCSCGNEFNNGAREIIKKDKQHKAVKNTVLSISYPSEQLLVRRVSYSISENTLIFPKDSLGKKAFDAMMLESNKQGVLVDSLTGNQIIEWTAHLDYYRFYSQNYNSFAYWFAF
ncbi:hypothetical protein [Flavobacterium sp. ACN6]|uniref:hypothetical protein n=1 Tax=Flavobacterium sp. ACN6 TaxID=1920426 RepID=UPI000BB3BD02|nr:hypothetical protein [Flavobacterium sp. ACN6]PBJ04602.1 hypothetical protein BSF42_44090 [Flavobacterium sp. ACN6]